LLAAKPGEIVDRVDCVVVGAGVIGLAIARELALAGHETVVLEVEKSIGAHASGRNSEVIHAGIYYPPGSLKAIFCVEGRRLLYQYCQEQGVAFRRTGKLIVATSEIQMATLEDYDANALANGVADITRLDAAALRELEPGLHGVAALFSPSTGIIDSHGLLLALQADLEAAGGRVVCDTPVNGVKKHSGGFIVITGLEPRYLVNCRLLVNAAGAGAQRLAAASPQVRPELVPEQQLVRGQYYSYSGKAPFRHLVYPVAGSQSLGIHLTLDLDGRARFGPDARRIEGLQYQFDNSYKDAFISAISDYYPGLDPDRLQPAYAGVRAALKASGPGPADFVVQGPEDHGVEGLVQLFGLESPGLTAALAVAGRVKGLLQ
jgi:L-2-hydroxyglutarate oxidase LhgO